MRPRRFGKSLLCDMLRCYYDVAEKANFERLFGGLAIGANPTPNASRYFVLSLDFSRVGRCEGAIWEAKFSRYMDMTVSELIRSHTALMSAQVDVEALLAERGPDIKYNRVVEVLKSIGYGLYVIVDEYDNFTNDIVATMGTKNYKEITYGTGFYRAWFKEFKASADRIFMTGVSPVTMDDLTSGFNIATNISLEPAFNAMVGFTQDETRRLFEDYNGCNKFQDDVEGHLRTVKAWYDSYCFSKEKVGVESLYNCDMALYYLSYLVANGRAPEKLIDANIRSDLPIT